MSQVAVRRGSITTTRMPGRARLAASMRWYSTGWHHAALEPASTSRSPALQVLVAARHRVGAESALVARDRRCHAQPRVGIDVGAADESLHQLVGHVVVLGQELPREVERHRLRPVLGDHAREAVGDARQRLVPARAPAIDHRVQQATREPAGLAQRGALRRRAARGWPGDRRCPPPRQSRLPPRAHPRRSPRRSTGRWCGSSRRRARSSPRRRSARRRRRARPRTPARRYRAVRDRPRSRG